MKRFLAALLAMMMVLGCLSGCGDNVEETKSPDTQGATSATEKPSEGETEGAKEPITTDPITLSVFVERSDAEADAANLWYFKYLEYWMKEQGYNITIEVTASEATKDQVSLMLATDTLADLYVGAPLTTSQAVMYGSVDGILLDWAPYLNEETMPNTWTMLQEHPDALVASTSLDGGIYGLPYLADRNRAEAAGDFTGNHALYINKNWLEECNLEVPTTMDEFINMLRTFKNEIKLEDGSEVIPCVSLPAAQRLERYIWAALGYYGASPKQYGNTFCIKDGEIAFPSYSEDYDTFIGIMRTLYEEGLISLDHYTMDAVTARGLIASGVCGVFGDWTMVTAVPDTFEDWVAAPALAIGDNEVYSSASANYKLNCIWASASTKYPEVLAFLMDYVNSPEGRAYYYYGPMQGEDPLNMVEGWYVDENGKITADSVEDGTFGSLERYAQRYIYPYQYGVPRTEIVPVVHEMAGKSTELNTYEVVDAVTGESVTIIDTEVYSDANADGYGRFSVMDAWEGKVTFVLLPGVYMSEEDSLRATELETVIYNHIVSESAKFITGTRSLSEIDEFKEELKAMDIEEYIELYRNAYSAYMDTIFK